VEEAIDSTPLTITQVLTGLGKILIIGLTFWLLYEISRMLGDSNENV